MSKRTSSMPSVKASCRAPSARVLPPSLTVGLGSTAEPVHAWSGIASTDARETSRPSGPGSSFLTILNVTDFVPV